MTVQITSTDQKWLQSGAATVTLLGNQHSKKNLALIFACTVECDLICIDIRKAFYGNYRGLSPLDHSYYKG